MASAQTPNGTIDVNYLPDEAVIAVAAHPRAMLTVPELSLLPLEVMSAMGKKEWGIDPLDVEEIVMHSSAPDAAGGPPSSLGMIIRFNKPHSLDTILPQLRQNTEAAELDGKPYLKATDPFAPNLMMLDDRTLLIGVADGLPAMLKAKKADTPLRQLFAKTKADNQMVAFVSIEAVRDQLNQQLANLPPLPGPLAELVTLPDQIDYVAMRLGMTNAMRLNAIVKSPDEKAAVKVEQLLNMALQMGKQAAIMQAMSEINKGDDEVIRQAGQQYVQRLASAIFDSLRPERNGTRVAIKVETEASAATAGVAVSLLLPAVQAAREAARRNVSTNNMKQIALAMHNYHDVYKGFPSRALVDQEGKPLLSWRVAILPYIEEQALYKQFRLDEPWDSDHNKQLIEKMPPLYRSPNSAGALGKSNYVVPTGKGTIFEKNEKRRIASITDGTSNTIMGLEVDDACAPIWTKPDDWQSDPNDPTAGLLIRAGGVFNVMFADGSVRAISTTIDPEMLQGLFTVAGGETISLD
jgi:prepilin-type processing-associated H-X9-DG protein